MSTVEKYFFHSWNPVDEELKKAALIAGRDVLKIIPGQRVLIITNPEYNVAEIARAIYDTCLTLDANPVLIFQPVKDQFSFTEQAVIGAIGTVPDILISLSHWRLGKDKEALSRPYEHAGKQFDSLFHYYLDGVKLTRSFWSPGTTVEMFKRTVPIDYGKLQKNCLKVKKILDEAVNVKIISDKGTNLIIGIENRSAMIDDGDFSCPGSGGNLPAGETFISPALGTASGVIVFDGSISTHKEDMILDEPAVVKVEAGYATEITGGSGAGLLRTAVEQAEINALQMEKEGKIPSGMGAIYRKNSRNLGELGIGLNPKAEIRGNMLEDEKAYGTCHIAIGSNYDEDAPSLIHLDCLIRQPTITALLPDGTAAVIMKKGVLVL